MESITQDVMPNVVTRLSLTSALSVNKLVSELGSRDKCAHTCITDLLNPDNW